MLKALGVTEGIAANDEEHIAWAVKFAEDHELRQRISRQIKTRSVEVLFNEKSALRTSTYQDFPWRLDNTMWHHSYLTS
jgi:predicted O-linked N-acetylglucosamine transferase (SPINDLY family)